MLRVTRQASPRLFYAALVRAGFTRGKEGAFKDSPEVRVICSAGVSRKNMLSSVTVGFWIHQLSNSPPPQFFNHCHIYGSLGSVVPRFNDLEAVEGHSNEDAWQELIGSSKEIAEELGSLLTTLALRHAFAQGRFADCLILKEARAFLQREATIPGTRDSIRTDRLR